MEPMEPFEILLVEDNARDAEMTMRALKKNGIASGVAWVKDGEQALDYVRATGAYAGRSGGHPRVVLLDLKLPKVDGFEVLAQLKGAQETRMIPVVVMTSSAEQSDLLASYKLMANSYIVKPVSYEHFVEAIGKAGIYWSEVNQVP
jgi:CheY-like chemotaxis protein